LDPSRYKREYTSIFATQGAKVASLSGWLQALADAHYPIDVVRQQRSEWLRTTSTTVDYMRAFGLQAADAVHLAVAGEHAGSFITLDADDFRSVAGESAPARLVVFVVSPPPTTGAPRTRGTHGRRSRNRPGSTIRPRGPGRRH
jgi:hypothetical protein